MTTTTLNPSTVRPVEAAEPGADRASSPRTRVRLQSFGRAIAAEWIKLRTLRSTWIGMASVAAILVGLGALAAAMSTGSVQGPGQNGGPFGGADALSTVLTGANFAVLVVGVLGSLAGAREYSSRMITATVAAVPRRWQIVLSKALVFGTVTAVTAVVGVLGAFWLGMSVLASSDAATVSLTDPGVLGKVLGMAGYITAIGVIGLGLGIILRSVAGSIGAVVAGVMVLPAIAGALLPDQWDAVLQYLPSSAGAAFTVVQGAGTDVLSSGAGVAVLVAWVLAAVGAAITIITRRDA